MKKVGQKWIETMRGLCEKHGLLFRQCNPYHFQISGEFIVNAYPTKGSVYVNGMVKGFRLSGYEQIISLARGDKNPGPVKKAKRKSSGYKHKKKYFWENNMRKCALCSESIESFDEMSVDHKVPLLRGGSNRSDNLQPAHVKCNNEKGNRMKL